MEKLQQNLEALEQNKKKQWDVKRKMNTRVENAQGQLHDMQQKHSESVAAMDNEMQELQRELTEKQTKQNELQDQLYAMESSFNTKAQHQVEEVALLQTSLTEAKSEYTIAFKEVEAAKKEVEEETNRLAVQKAMEEQRVKDAQAKVAQAKPRKRTAEDEESGVRL